MTWGIRPYIEKPYNGTILCAGEIGEEFGVADFNAKYSMRLAFFGDGTFDNDSGFSTLQWLGSPSSAFSASLVWYDADLNGDFAVGPASSTEVPLDFAGSLDDLDPEAELYDSYEDLWHTFWFGTLIYDTDTKKAYRIATSASGSDFATMKQVDCDIEESFDTPPSPASTANKLDLIPCVESKKVYLGAEIPQRCVWMADKLEAGASAADFEGWDDETLALATWLDALPADVAGGVALEITSMSVGESGEVGESSGAMTLAWSFTKTNAAGEESAVGALRGGAALYLETAASAEDLGTADATLRALDPTAGSVEVSTGGDIGFARLVLAVP
ncbi:MAG: hypothetical protein IJS46_01515 [Kiritimatiellae bacterium]|nr:hypothetical protein [Kiritimatiellia bacterium]